MKQFNGFPARMQFTPVPNIFLGTLLPEISDITELKTTLHVFEVLYRKRGYPRYTTYKELLNNASLVKSLKAMAETPDIVLRKALELAIRRGTILHLALDRDGTAEDIYLLNSESNRQVAARIQNGELLLSGLKAGGQACTNTDELPDIFTLYEQNIGMLTPLIADELLEAGKLYPETWINDAIKEAVALNKRNWRYIARILESWSSEGRSDGTHRRDYQKKTDPDKYIKGKYGHMVRR